MAVRMIRWSELVATPWANGLGMTREIARSPAAGEFSWRLSAADVPSTAPFSPLPGIERHLGVLAGGALDVSVAGEVRRVDIGGAPIVFDGGEPTQGAPVGGPVIDLNLMIRVGMAVGTLESIVAGPIVLRTGFSAIVAGPIVLRTGFSAIVALTSGLGVRIDGESYELEALDVLVREPDATDATDAWDAAVAIDLAGASGTVAYLARVAL